MSFKHTITKIGNQIIKFLSGEKLLDWGIQRHLGLIFTIFILTVATITWDLMVETRLVVAQKNEQILQDLEISYHQLTIDLVGMDKRTKIENMLHAAGSDLKSPVEPPQKVEL